MGKVVKEPDREQEEDEGMGLKLSAPGGILLCLPRLQSGY